MPRTVIYPYVKRAAKPELGDLIEIELNLERGNKPATKGRFKATETVDTSQTADTYVAKLAKFIPAETIAFYAPAAALVKDHSNLLVVAAVVGFLGTPLYLLATAAKLEKKLQPKWYFYLLASLAFIAWALSTSKLGLLVGMDETESAFTLTVSVFLIPALDSFFTSISQRKE